MADGVRTQIAGEYEAPKGVIGIVVAPKFPDPQIIRDKIEEGIARVSPDAVWVIREKRQTNHAVNAAWETLEAHGIEPMLAPLTPAWKGEKYDLRRAWRDAEMHSYCERIVVFHDITSHVTAEFADRKDRSPAKVFVIERGKKKTPRARKGRKPVGV